MRAATFLLHAVLVAQSFATPRHHDQNHKHHETSHALVSGKPFPLVNVTNFPLATASEHHFSYAGTSTIVVEAGTTATYKTPKSEEHNAEDKVAVEQTSTANDACRLVTVTFNPTVTITVVPSASQAAQNDAISAVPLISSTPNSQSEISASSVDLSDGVSISRLVAPSAKLSGSPSVHSVDSIANANPKAPSVSLSVTQPINSQTSIPPSYSDGHSTKRGIIASGKDQKLLVNAFTPYNKISWLGDWYSGPPTNLPPTMQFVPQNYGRQSDVNGEWTSNAKKAIAAGDKYFLSFGEPGTPNAQLYMDPQAAVNLFMEKMQPYAEQGVSIGAPGTLQNDQDFTWLSTFLNLCDKAGCKIGFLAMHWFWTAEADHVQGFKDTLAKNVALAKGKPVWVDNFQAAGSVAAQKEFLQQVVPWLDEQETVARYAYVPVDRGNGEGFLNDGDGKLSELGEFFATL